MLLKKTMPRNWVPLCLAAFGILLFLSAAKVASAAPCDFKSSPPPFIRHDTGNSYCELCGYGYITVEITNPYERLGAIMSNMTLVEDLGISGLEYESTAPNAITYRLNGTPFAGPAPVISGGGAVLTFNIPGTLEPHFNNNQFNTITVTFAVRRVTDPEGLSGADRTIQATLTFDTDSSCTDSPQSDTDVLTLREPRPAITKTGWNYDAGQRQGSASDPVFGNSNDDIVWRIRIQNNGQADLQDLRFDDLMDTGNMTVNYACPTEASANAVAANNGVLPGGSPCVSAGNTINDFIVTGDFGASQDNTYPWGAGYEVDVVAGSSTSVYLVGKVASDGSCTTDRTNTVEDVQWGCQAQSPAGGITSAEGAGPPGDTARLVTQYMDGYPALRVERQLTGTNTTQPVGTKGTMTITITNNTGGSVKDIQLDDVLPPEYVVDSTYTPTIAVTSPYGSYRGRVSTLVWTNPQAGTFPLVSTDPADPLANTNPTFDLTSNGDFHPDYPDQINMLRHGDEVVITFRVILIESNYYDRSANLDETPEVYPTFDPTYQATLTNTLTVDFDTFCPAQGHQTFILTGNGTGNPTGTAIPADPEDLDIAIGGGVFILTGDPAQTLTLPVLLTNNGGHDAADYHAFVTFGATMQVQSAQAGCVEISPLSGSPVQPDPWKVWVKSAVPADQIPIPATATVYECTSPAVIAPGQTVTYNFDVVKTTDPTRIAIDDLTFRADVVGEITLSDGTPLWFPTPIARADGELDRADNYSLDTVWARVIGFNLKKTQVGTCSENNPPIIDTDANGEPVERVEIGEECTYHIDTGGWFGFKTPGFLYIAVQNIDVEDESPDGQAYISSTNPYDTSTSLIADVTFNGLSPVTEGRFDWHFNKTDAYQITVADEWFRVDFTSRILNDAVNSRSAPNYHGQISANILNSTFDAIFQNENTGDTETFALGPGAVGYPNEPIRRVDETITEPHLEVVKEVCNETLHGTGTSCDTWTTLTDEGDTYDSYIFRITVRNQASSGGLASAPAYDVVVTDTLDSSDLMYVLPFDADGLDNDGDTTFDESGTNEGAISNNTVLDGTAAVITFSHSHSSALQRIDPGSEVYLYYRVDPDEHALPLQDLVNTVAASYDTLAGSSNQSGNQTVDLRLNGDIGGARVYTDASASATVRILDVVSYPKAITDLSNTTIGSGSPQPVSIGEEIEYELAADLPVARLRSLSIQDDLPAGLRCSEAPTVNLSQPPYDVAGFKRPDGSAVPPIVPQCLDSGVTWDFGDVVLTQKPSGSSYFHFPLTFIARVDNAAANNDGDSLINGQPATTAVLEYIDDLNNTITKTFGQVEVVVAEPDIALTKSFAPVVNADAGDRITITVTAVNNGTAAAYNLRILDDLTGRDMTYVPGSAGGADAPDSVNISLFGANQPVFIWNPTRPLAPGATFSFTFDVSVDLAAQPLEVLDNTIQADWTSLPGQTTALNTTGAIGADGGLTGMRIGALPNAGDAVNDYEATAGAQVTVPALTLDKTDLDAAVVPAMGVHKRFTIDVRLPEGTTNNVTVTDSLDTGSVSYVLANNATYDITYTFQGIAAINGQPPAETAFTAFPADGAGGTAVWNIGTVVTQSEDDPDQSAIAPLIRIQYYGRVNNDLVTDNGDTLGNSVDTTYTNGETGGTETLTDTTTVVTAVEPVLTAVKTVSNVTTGKQPADPPAGGDLLEYTVTVLNSGTAEAFDVNLVDTLPSSLELYTGFTPTAEINSSSVTGFTATPANSPGGPLVWGRDNGDGSLDIPVGQSLVLVYRCVVLAAGGDLTNRVYVDWTSLDGADTYERTGAGCPSWTAPNDYCTGPAEATTTTVDTNNIVKTVAADTYNIVGDAVARVGDIITYRLAVNLSGGLTRSLTVQDTLPGGMVFAETVSINGDTAADYTPPAGGTGSNFSYAAITSANVPTVGQTGALTWTIGDVINDPFGDPTTDTLEIVYRARIMPDAGIVHVASTTLTNTVDMDYSTTVGPAATQTDSADLTVVQPVLAVTKTAVAANGDSVLDAGEIVTYTVEIANSGNAPAYDAVLEDIVPVGMRSGAATITVTEMRLLSGAVWPNLAPAYDAATGAAVWDFDSGTADQYSIPAGDTLHIVYQLQAETGIGAGLTLTNQARVTHYYSFDDDAVPAQGSATGQRQDYGATNTASVTFTTAMPDPPLKDNPATTTVAVGEPFTYTITVPSAPQAVALHDVRILDDLSASAADLNFIGVTKKSGTQPWTPVNTGTATSLVIEDTTTGIEIPAGQQIEVEITVVLADTGTNVTGLTFTNTASYTFNAVDGDPGTQLDGGSDTTGPMTIVGSGALTLEKSGPAAMQVGTAATFTLNVYNPGTGTAWNPTITDRLPNETNGGMCAAGPSNVTAQLFADAAGTIPVSPVLTEGTDYTVTFNGEPDCEWTLSLLSAAGGIGADQYLIITYDAELDPDTANGIVLTNYAWATQWFSADPNATGAAPHTFTETLTDGTPGTLDHEDSHDVTTQAPVLQFTKSVVNMTTGQDPGANATPGDTLRYTLRVVNTGPVGLTGFSITDDLGQLNAVPVFAPNTLSLAPLPPGADSSATDGAGGTNGTGLVDIANLDIGVGAPNDTLTVVFDVTLAPVITSGTVVRNQATVVYGGADLISSDDPNLSISDPDPTETLIASAPDFQVLKTAAILSGDPTVLMAGETLRYTITIKNIGTEDAVDVRLRDDTPANTTYVAGSTTLNGTAVTDPGPGVNPLTAGIPVNAPENTTAGYLRADAAVGATNVATVTFDVVVDPDVMDGLVIANQGFVSGSGAGSGVQPEQPSDDPNTPAVDDPTLNIVGNLPLLYARKTVEIFQDLGTPGIVDPGDVLRYTIAISNYGAIPATGVVLTDGVPDHTVYVADSMRLNGVPLGSDGGISPLLAGLPMQSADNPGAGIISPGFAPGGGAVVTFEARVDAGALAGDLITNQGSVASAELPLEPTDADGVPSNGDQPTIIVVGAAQYLTITKEVGVVGGGAALAGGQLEYTLRATNVGSLAATNVSVTDDLSPPLGDLVTYVAGSGTLNGAAAGVTYAGSVLTADYAGQYGDLAPGATVVVRFRVQIDAGLALGTTIANTGVAHWNNPEDTASASVSIDVGGTPGSAALNGDVWHDANLDRICDPGAETLLQGWSVALYRNNQLVTTVTTDAAGRYRLSGLVPNAGTTDIYELRFQAAGAGANTPSLGMADSPFTDGPQRISAITVASGANPQNLNLPIWPNGTVYNSVAREPVAGATVAMLNATTGAALPVQCFDDAAQQNQVTALDGFYKFDLNFGDAACPAGGDYLISVTPPVTGFQTGVSQVIPPSSDAATAPFSVPACPGTASDAVPATSDYCEATTLATVPPVSVLPRTAGTIYHLHLTLGNGTVPGQSQIFNNPIPLDPVLDGAVAITKTSSLINVNKGSLVPYTITVTNVYGAPLYDIAIVDRFPAGFKYVEDSARLDGRPAEPTVNGRELTWDGLDLQVNQKYTLRLLLVVGAGVSEGEYVNRAQVINTAMNAAASGEASATVRVIPDPDFDCTDVIGKVFDDRDLNGSQDDGENGLGGVRVVTARGLIATSDEHGRFHITCAAVPDQDLGSNFILKLDERSLPTGYRLTTENPRVQRATRGKMLRFNFGATIHRVVRLDISDGVFEPETSAVRLQWQPRIQKLLDELRRAPSVLRLSYLADVERESLVNKRLSALKKEITGQWDREDGGYPLAVETEIFWRRGAPVAGR